MREERHTPAGSVQPVKVKASLCGRLCDDLLETRGPECPDQFIRTTDTPVDARADHQDVYSGRIDARDHLLFEQMPPSLAPRGHQAVDNADIFTCSPGLVAGASVKGAIDPEEGP